MERGLVLSMAPRDDLSESESSEDSIEARGGASKKQAVHTIVHAQTQSRLSVASKHQEKADEMLKWPRKRLTS